MSSMVFIVGLSVWFAFVAGGCVWFVWGFCQNISDKVATFREARKDPAPATEKTE